VPIPGVILPAENWASTALKRLPAEGRLDFAALFGRSAPLALDIGCGNGRFVISSAIRRPDWDHVGIDILPMVIRYATRRANQRGLGNCRFAACDGWRLLSQLCAPSSVNEIHIYHPQPYADEHRHQLRVLTPEFLALVHKALRPGGKLFLQTDNPAYWGYIEQVVSATMNWNSQEGAWPEDPLGRSRREIVAIEQGLHIFRGWASKRDDLEDESLAAIIATLPQPDFKATEHPSHRNHRARRPHYRRRR
jgi:tRNA (guanine-N7-)-methyltransferase